MNTPLDKMPTQMRFQALARNLRETTCSPTVNGTYVGAMAGGGGLGGFRGYYGPPLSALYSGTSSSAISIHSMSWAIRLKYPTTALC